MNRYLIFGDGTIFCGTAAGAESCDRIGEVVFNTSAAYMQTLNDPTNSGQILVQTFPLCASCGAVGKAKAYPAAYIAREFCSGSNYASEGELDKYLKEQNVAAITGLDTRELTRRLLATGETAAMITDSTNNLEQKIKAVKRFKNNYAIKDLSVREVMETGQGKSRVVLIDLGAAQDIQNALCARGCTVIRVPFDYSARQISDLKPDGIVISDGVWDADGIQIVVETIKAPELALLPVLGIGLGHLVMAQSKGCAIKKLKHGHRGTNIPVKDAVTGRVYITNQNHGYIIENREMEEKNIKARYLNVNDKSVEGIVYDKGISVQFRPEAKDTEGVYSVFEDLLKQRSDYGGK